MAKVAVAAAFAALTMALLGYAAGGRLGNFGDVGVDQGTFGIAVFLWFSLVGAITVVMANGVTRSAKRPKPPPSPRPIEEVADDEPPASEQPDLEDVADTADEAGLLPVDGAEDDIGIATAEQPPKNPD